MLVRREIEELENLINKIDSLEHLFVKELDGGYGAIHRFKLSIRKTITDDQNSTRNFYSNDKNISESYNKNVNKSNNIDINKSNNVNFSKSNNVTNVTINNPVINVIHVNKEKFTKENLKYFTVNGLKDKCKQYKIKIEPGAIRDDYVEALLKYQKYNL